MVRASSAGRRVGWLQRSFEGRVIRGSCRNGASPPARAASIDHSRAIRLCGRAQTVCARARASALASSLRLSPNAIDSPHWAVTDHDYTLHDGRASICGLADCEAMGSADDRSCLGLARWSRRHRERLGPVGRLHRRSAGRASHQRRAMTASRSDLRKSPMVRTTLPPSLRLQ